MGRPSLTLASLCSLWILPELESNENSTTGLPFTKAIEIKLPPKLTLYEPYQNSSPSSLSVVKLILMSMKDSVIANRLSSLTEMYPLPSADRPKAGGLPTAAVVVVLCVGVVMG